MTRCIQYVFMREVLSEQPTGLMQDWPLTVDKMLDHAARWHGGSEIVSRFPSGSILRSDYSRLHDAAKRISTALISLGVQRGDRIATLGSNSFDHLSLWYGIMGIGAVCHTLNPRLPKAQLGYIANHAGDVMLFADSVLFAPVFGAS
jgi:acyl-CoA synthetase (AMP-forming)/AMP-acid ligase II